MYGEKPFVVCQCQRHADEQLLYYVVRADKEKEKHMKPIDDKWKQILLRIEGKI